MKKLLIVFAIILSVNALFSQGRPTPFRQGLFLGSFEVDPIAYQAEGYMYYNTTINRVKEYTSEGWRAVGFQNLGEVLTVGNDSYQSMSIGNSLLIHSSNASPSHGLLVTVDEDTNGAFPISLYPNNVATPGLIIGGTPNFPISFVVSNSSELTIEQTGVRIGTNATGYKLPKVRGTSGQVLTMGSNEYASWQNASADNALNYVTVTDSIYTLQEADILAYKPHIIETYRADGTTQADTVTVTYPRDITPPTNEMLAVSFTNISGSAIKIVPDSTVVIDKRTKTQRQYVLPKDYLGSASLFSVSQDTIWANGSDWVISDYTYTPPIVASVPVLESFSHTEIATDATSVVATAPTGIQDDDILIMIVSLDENATTNAITSTGFTELDNYDLSGSHKQTVLWKRASSESGNYTVNLTDAQDGVVSIVRISGATTSGSPFDVVGVTNDAFADNITPNDITSTETNTLALSFCSVDRNYRVSGSSTVSGAGWSLISTPASYGADGVGFMWAEKDVPTTGAVGQPTFTFDSSDQSIALTINIKS